MNRLCRLTIALLLLAMMGCGGGDEKGDAGSAKPNTPTKKKGNGKKPEPEKPKPIAVKPVTFYINNAGPDVWTVRIDGEKQKSTHPFSYRRYEIKSGPRNFKITAGGGEIFNKKVTIPPDAVSILCPLKKDSFYVSKITYSASFYGAGPAQESLNPAELVSAMVDWDLDDEVPNVITFRTNAYALNASTERRKLFKAAPAVMNVDCAYAIIGPNRNAFKKNLREKALDAMAEGPLNSRAIRALNYIIQEEQGRALYQATYAVIHNGGGEELVDNYKTLPLASRKSLLYSITKHRKAGGKWTDPIRQIIYAAAEDTSSTIREQTFKIMAPQFKNENAAKLLQVMLKNARAPGERARMEFNLTSALEKEYRTIKPEAIVPALKIAWSRAHVNALWRRLGRLSRKYRKPLLESIVKSFPRMSDSAREGIFRYLSSFSSEQQKALADMGLKDRRGRVRHATAEAALKNRIQTEYLPRLAKSRDRWVQRAYHSFNIKITAGQVYKKETRDAAVRQLQKYLQSSDPVVSFEAFEQLNRLNKQFKLGVDITRVCIDLYPKYKDKYSRQAIVNAAPRGEKESAAFFNLAVADEDPDIRKKAFDLLGSIASRYRSQKLQKDLIDIALKERDGELKEYMLKRVAPFVKALEK